MTNVFAQHNKRILTTQFSGPSYEAGITAGTSAGEQGQAPPVEVSIDALVAGDKIFCNFIIKEDLEQKPEPNQYDTPLNYSFSKPTLDNNIFPQNIKPKKNLNYPYPKRDQPLRSTEYPADLDLSALLTCLPVNTESPAYRAGVVVGYVAGVADYVAKNGILRPSDMVPDVPVPDDLFSQLAWQAYARGIALEAPQQQYFSGASTNENINPDGFIDQLFIFEELRKDRERTAGYRLGFAVGIMREHGVALQTWQVPSSTSEYDAFMRGMRGERLAGLESISSNQTPTPQDSKKGMDMYYKPKLYSSVIKSLNYPNEEQYTSIKDLTADFFAIRNRIMYIAGQSVSARSSQIKI